MNKHADSNIYDYTILGLGASGINLALAMIKDDDAKKKKILIVEKDSKSENDRTWCFWDLKNNQHSFPILQSWDIFTVKSPDFAINIPLEDYKYNMVRSRDFYKYALESLKEEPNVVIINDEITDVSESNEKVVLHGLNNSYETSLLFTSVMDYDIHSGRHPWLNQHFGGWFIKTDEPVFKGKNPSFMNFDIPQEGATQFMYELPYREDECLIEFTIFSEDIYLKERYDEFLSQFLKDNNITNYTVTEKEYGVIPMTSYPFWKHNTKRKMYIGTAGGWTKSSTGYTFYFCQKFANQLTGYLKNNNDLRNFIKPGLDYRLDQILLGVLQKHPELGSEIFSNMFKKNKIRTILRFLNGESNIFEKIMVITKTKFPLYFFNSLLRILLKL